MALVSQVMFDAIKANASQIPRMPAPPFAVGGYINGAIQAFQWEPATWGMFPNSYHVRINVTGDPTRGNALDVENGDAQPGDVQEWIETRGKVATDPLLVYCNRSNLAACLVARDAAFTATGTYAFMWVATLDGTVTGAAATQFTSIRDTAGNAVADVTLISDQRLLAAMAAVLRPVAGS